MDRHGVPQGDIPPAVAFQATHPGTTGPEPLPETGATRVVDSRYCVLMTPMPMTNFVEILDLATENVADAVSDVRDLLRTHGRRQAAWTVASTWIEMQDQLTSLGMTPYEDPPLEPSYAAMALVTPPQGPVSEGVLVREAEELADFVAIGELAATLFNIEGEDRTGLIETMKGRYALRAEGRSQINTYLALIDDELVGEAQSVMTVTGTNLAGSSVAPSARGRGVYRALVAARWDEAVARGLPALTVQAGQMSRPILERLGFQTVATQLTFRDRFE